MPKELTSPCIIIMDRETRDCWSMEGRPIWAMRFTAVMWNRGIFMLARSGSQGSFFIRWNITTREAMAHIP